jgi:hypothetical protein
VLLPLFAHQHFTHLGVWGYETLDDTYSYLLVQAYDPERPLQLRLLSVRQIGTSAWHCPFGFESLNPLVVTTASSSVMLYRT